MRETSAALSIILPAIAFHMTWLRSLTRVSVSPAGQVRRLYRNLPQGTSSRSLDMKCPAEVYQPSTPCLYAIARCRLSLPRQDHCRYPWRKHLSEEQND